MPEVAIRFRVPISAGHTRAQLDHALNLIDDVVATPLRVGA
jgi:hypothetical protein